MTLNLELRATAIVWLFLLAAYGWGRLAHRILDRRILTLHSLTAVVGLAVMNFVGGLLNVAHAAAPPVLLLMLIIGVAAAGRDIIRRRPWRRRYFAPGALALLLAAGIAAAAALLLVPTALFNYHDDFQTYTPRAVLMAQTGTLSGNAFAHFGLDSLGSQSFFHGFFLEGAGIRLLHGFDAVACFALCLLLVAELCLRWRMSWWLGVTAVLALTWFNPQVVNVSPVYSGAAGVMALVLCGMFAARDAARGTGRTAWRLALPLGMLAAWLAAAKVSFAFFAALFLGVLFVLVALPSSSRRTALRTGGATALTGFLALLPWALLPLPALLKARAAAEPFLASAPLADKYPSLACHEIPLLFWPARLMYGNWPLHFLAVATVALAIGLAALAHWFRRGGDRASSGLAAVTAGGVAMIVTLFVNSHLFTIGSAVRFACPVLIGGLFTALPGYLRFRTRAIGSERRWGSAALAAGLVVMMAMFHGTFLKRLDTVVRARGLLSFPVQADYESYCRNILSPEEAAYHGQVQTNAPAGATVLVWTAAPFLFDHERNRVFTLCGGGIINPALRFPAGLPAAELGRYFRENGVRFILMEPRGYGVMEAADFEQYTRYAPVFCRKYGEFGLYLRRAMDELAAQSTVRFSDGRMVMFELTPPPAETWRQSAEMPTTAVAGGE